MPRSRPWALAAFVVACWCGCYSAVHPRPARVARPGKLSGDAHLPLVTLAWGEADGTLPSGERATVAGFSGPYWDGTRFLVPPLWWAGTVRLGLFPPCEGGIVLRGSEKMSCEATLGRCNYLK